jgi:alcohol dehydrogenase class IV
MTSFTLSSIPDIHFGARRSNGIADDVEKLAGRGAAVIIVADPALAPLGVTERIAQALRAAAFVVYVYDAFKGEPKSADIDAVAELARKRGARAIVGLGGGTALDTAKLAACCAVSGESASAYELCRTPLPGKPLAVIAIPTTAGTGSEVTRVSVYANATGEKVWAWGAELKPRVAILDPELTVAVPPAVTAATGLDALVHAIEASTNKQRNDGNGAYCHKAISLITANLAKAVKNPEDIEARGAMLLGSCFAGIGIDNCGTALAHNISHALADLAPIAHGRATGLAMLATYEWVMEGNPDAFAEVASAMGQKDGAKAYEALVRETGIKVALDGEGFDLEKPELLAERMAAAANAPMRKSTLRYPSDEDLLMLAKKVYALA